MATGSPFGRICNAMDGDPEIRVRIQEIRIFRNFFFASMDLFGPQGHPLDVPVPPNPDPDREIRFFENPDFSFFRFFKLKDPTIWVSMDSSGPNYVTVLSNSPLIEFWGLGSIHNVYNMPMEPERAAKARSDVKNCPKPSLCPKHLTI